MPPTVECLAKSGRPWEVPWTSCRCNYETTAAIGIFRRGRATEAGGIRNHPVRNEVIVTDGAVCQRHAELVTRCVYGSISAKIQPAIGLGEFNPGLIMAGRFDPICSMQCTDVLSNGIPNNKTVVFEKSSHFFLMEEAEKAMQTLTDWFANHTP